MEIQIIRFNSNINRLKQATIMLLCHKDITQHIYLLKYGTEVPPPESSKKAARPPFLEAVQAIFNLPITSLWIKLEA